MIATIVFLGFGLWVVAYITEGTFWQLPSTKRRVEARQRAYEIDLEHRRNEPRS